MSLDIYGKHSLGEQIEFELVLSAMYEEELLNVTKLLSKDQKLSFINTVQEVLLMDVVSDEYAKKVMSEFDIKIYDNIAQSYLSTTSSNDIIIANTNNKTINAGKGNDIIYTNGGSINTGDGADVIISSEENESFYGGEGADIYGFYAGFGRDEINNYHTDNSKDIIKFADISADDIAFSKNGSDLIITAFDDKLTIKNALNNIHYAFSKIIFEDESKISFDEIKLLVAEQSLHNFS